MLNNCKKKKYGMFKYHGPLGKIPKSYFTPRERWRYKRMSGIGWMRIFTMVLKNHHLTNIMGDMNLLTKSLANEY